MTDITIPPEALEAAESAYCEAWDRDEPALLAACIAMLRAWPGSYSLTENDSAEIRDVAAIILPLTEKQSG